MYQQRWWLLHNWTRIAIGVIAIVVILLGLQPLAHAGSKDSLETSGRLVTVYDRGMQRAFLTKEKVLGKALAQEGFELDGHDIVEPSLDEELVAPEYKVNIYRSRPVVVVDGATRIRVMTPYQTPEQIVKDAKIIFYEEDAGTISRLQNVAADGAGLQLTIQRATPFVLDLYGKKLETRTQAKTVGEMLRMKGIKLGPIDQVSVPLTTSMYAGLEVRVWREGKQTVTIEQPTPFVEEIIYDADRPIGYRAISDKGTPGSRAVTYEIEIKDGVEISRIEIASVATKAPVSQKLRIGIKGIEAGLSKSRGAMYFTDSKGVSHRETYYDLDMGVVMRSCGQGGAYTIRFDGVKIDREGYILVAANYALYPKCSIVETSLGPARVYDTGGFVLRHPHGIDIATDWTNYNGR